MILRFAKKNSSSNREIEKYYGENEVIEIDEEEYKLIMLEIKVNGIVTDMFDCGIRAYEGPDDYREVRGFYPTPDLSSYRPVNGMLT